MLEEKRLSNFRVFAENVVAVVFVISIILSLVLPENMEIKKLGE